MCSGVWTCAHLKRPFSQSLCCTGHRRTLVPSSELMVLITLGEVKVSSSSSSDLIEGVSKSPSNAIIDDGFKVLFLFFTYCTNKVIKRGGKKLKLFLKYFITRKSILVKQRQSINDKEQEWSFEREREKHICFKK